MRTDETSRDCVKEEAGFCEAPVLGEKDNNS